MACMTRTVLGIELAEADCMCGLPCTWRRTPRTGQILGGTVQLETVLGGPTIQRKHRAYVCAAHN